MNEAKPNSNVCSFAEAKLKKENEEILIDNQEFENMARATIQHNPDLLLPFMQIKEEIISLPNSLKEVRSTLCIHLFQTTADIFHAETQEDAMDRAEELYDNYINLDLGDDFIVMVEKIKNLGEQYLEYFEEQDSNVVVRNLITWRQ